MKFYFKKTFKLLILLTGISFVFLYNCEKETDFIETIPNQTTEGLQISESSFSQLFKNQKFKDAYLETIENKNLASKKYNKGSKSKDSDLYDFVIDSSTIKQVDHKKSTSYTMYIKRKEKSSNFFENLVIKIDSMHKTSAYILKYTYSKKPVIYHAAHDSYSFDGEVEATRIDPNKINGLFSKSQSSCVNVSQLQCNNNGAGSCSGAYHVAGPNCNSCIVMKQLADECGYYDDESSGSDGSGGGYDGEGGTTSGGGDGSYSDPNNNDPDQLVTIPNDCKDCDDEVTTFPLLQYPLNSGYETTYPKLTEYLINRLPNVVDIPKIINAIKIITGLPESQIKEDLTWGKGPTIHITQLDNFSSRTSDKTVGLFSPNEPDVVHLDIDYVNELENLITDQSQEDAFLFFLGTTLLHEYVHFGDNQDGMQFRDGIEEGKLFEIIVYGEDVNSTNAGFILEDKN